MIAPGQTRRRMWAVLLAALAGLGVTVRAQLAETPAARESSDAYVALVQADQARDQQGWDAALAGYRDAMERYRRLTQAYPDYEPDIVQYRIAYCGNQIEAIRRRTGAAPAEPLAEPVLSPAAAEEGAETEESYRERYFALLRESQYIRQRLGELEASTQEAGSAVTNDVVRLLEENQELKDELEALRAATNEAAAASAGQLNALRVENEQLRAELDAARKLGEMARDEARDEQAAALRSELERLRREKDELVRAMSEMPVAGAAAPSAAPETGGPAASLMRSAAAQERQGNLAAALSLYERALEEQPAQPQAALGKARCLLGLERADEALKVIRSPAVKQAAGTESQLLLGIALGMKAEYREAVDVLKPVVRQDPAAAAARNALGAAWMGWGKTREAREELEQAVDLDPRLGDAHYNLAQVLSLGAPADREAAREHYDRAVELGVPADPDLEKLLSR